MRRRYFTWTWLVFGLILTIYGGYSVISNCVQGQQISVLGLAFLIAGGLLLISYFVLLLLSYFQSKDNTPPDEDVIEQEEMVEISIPQENEKEENTVIENSSSAAIDSNSEEDNTYIPYRNYSRYDNNYDTIYVSKVGHGPVLRITGPEILDMRSNTYYSIDGNIVKQHGSGPVYEISGNRIRLAFGSYLYEISGSNVNKTFGGFYASISSGILQTHDLQEKYEIRGNLNLKQQLAVVALLFGTY